MCDFAPSRITCGAGLTIFTQEAESLGWPVWCSHLRTDLIVLGLLVSNAYSVFMCALSKNALVDLCKAH